MEKSLNLSQSAFSPYDTSSSGAIGDPSSLRNGESQFVQGQFQVSPNGQEMVFNQGASGLGMGGQEQISSDSPYAALMSSPQSFGNQSQFGQQAAPPQPSYQQPQQPQQYTQPQMGQMNQGLSTQQPPLQQAQYNFGQPPQGQQYQQQYTPPQQQQQQPQQQVNIPPQQLQQLQSFMNAGQAQDTLIPQPQFAQSEGQNVNGNMQQQANTQPVAQQMQMPPQQYQQQQVPPPQQQQMQQMPQMQQPNMGGMSQFQQQTYYKQSKEREKTMQTIMDKHSEKILLKKEKESLLAKRFPVDMSRMASNIILVASIFQFFRMRKGDQNKRRLVLLRLLLLQFGAVGGEFYFAQPYNELQKEYKMKYLAHLTDQQQDILLGTGSPTQVAQQSTMMQYPNGYNGGAGGQVPYPGQMPPQPQLMNQMAPPPYQGQQQMVQNPYQQQQQPPSQTAPGGFQYSGSAPSLQQNTVTASLFEKIEQQASDQQNIQQE